MVAGHFLPILLPVQTEIESIPMSAETCFAACSEDAQSDVEEEGWEGQILIPKC